MNFSLPNPCVLFLGITLTLQALDYDYPLQKDMRHADPGAYLGHGDLTDDIIPADLGYDMGHEDLMDRSDQLI